MREFPSLTRHPNIARKARSSVLNTTLNTALAIAGLLCADTLSAVKPMEQPARLQATDNHNPPRHPLPSPDDDMETIMTYIETVEDMADFLEKYVSQTNAEGVSEFLETYREPPRKLQNNNWKGPCNSLAEFTAQWAYRHGGQPYTVTLRPERFKGYWHQFTVCRTPEGFVIFDNNSVRSAGSLAEYLSLNHPDRCIWEIGGLIEWKLVRDTLRAKALEHMQLNETNLETAPLPRREAEEPLKIAAGPNRGETPSGTVAAAEVHESPLRTI